MPLRSEHRDLPPVKRLSVPLEKTSPETWTRIVAAARVELGVHGADGMRMRAVADRAQISVGTVQYYFPAKEDLVEAALDPWQDQIEMVVDAAVRALREAPNPEEVFLNVATTMFRLLRMNPADHRARQLDTLRRGSLHRSRRRRYLIPLMERAANAAASRFGESAASWAFRIRSVEFVISRFAIMGREEIGDLLGVEASEMDEEGICQFIESQLRNLVLAIVRGSGAAPHTFNPTSCTR